MHITILGTGGTVGMPVPLCDCQFCSESEVRRRRPGLMITQSNTTVIFDIGPDISDQLIETDTTSVDAFFVTHAHDDHISGILDLHKVSAFAEIPVTVFAEQAVWSYVDDVFPWIEVSRREVFPQAQLSIGPLTIEPFRIEHSEQFPEVGYSITDGQRTAVYAPDVYSIEDKDQLGDVDMLFVDGLYLLGKVFEEDDDHAGPDRLRQEIESIDADRTVLLNVSEHWHGVSTVEFATEAGEYEVWRDFNTIQLGNRD